MKILSFGEILWDVYPDKKYIGGAPFNFAAHLAKHGEEVYMLSALGQDELGNEALEKLKKWSIFTDYITMSNKKQTGRCMVTLKENSIPTYNLLQDVAYDFITCDNVTDAFDVLYFGTLAFRSEYNFNSLSSLLKTNRFKEVFVDINIRPPFYSEETVQFSVKNATVLKISLEELSTVAKLLKIPYSADYKAFTRKLADIYPSLKCIITTLGADGAYAFDCTSGKEFFVGSENVKMVSTVGAGDSFSSAFLFMYLRKNDIKHCLEYASKIAGFVVSKYDAVPDYNIKDFI